MESSDRRIKIAVQKSGRLTDKSLDLLERCGLTFTKSKNQLFCYGQNMPIDLLLVRDDDIPGLINDDVCDLGIVGLNTAHEKQLAIENSGKKVGFDELRRLDYGACRLSIAAPDGRDYSGVKSLEGSRIATSYVDTLRHYLNENSVQADIVYFSGAVEIAPRLGQADFICDLVSTGSTLEANHLREVATILKSEAIIIQSKKPLANDKQELIDKIMQRMDGVLQVRESKYIMLHAPRSALDEITRLLPGAESPTVIPLEDNKIAVHAVCREYVFWETLENLKSVGASCLLVLPVEKMLA